VKAKAADVDADAELLADASVGASATAPGMASKRLGEQQQAVRLASRERVASALGLHRNRKRTIMGEFPVSIKKYRNVM